MSTETRTADASLPTGVVTFLLTDVVSSTSTWERAPEAMAAALARHDGIVADAVKERGGVLLKARGEGDSTFSVFPRASDAAVAAVAAQAALGAEPWPEAAALQVRMALHTGEAFERDGDYYGQVVNRAARLRAVAGPEEIVLSKATAELILDRLPAGSELVELGSQVLGDVARPETVYRLLPGRPGPSETAGPSEPAVPTERPVPLPAKFAAVASFAGRSHELDLLAQSAAHVAGGRGRVVLIDGEPGVGKTSLATEAARAAHGEGFAVLYGRCDEDIAVPYQPFVEALRHYVEHAPRDVLATHVLRHGSAVARLVPQLTDRVGAIPAVHTDDPETERYLLFEAVVNLLALAAERQPLVLVLDDLHWADRNTLSLVRHLVQSSATRILVVGLYRGSDLGPAHPLHDVVAALHREADCERLVLSGLDEDELVALLEVAADQPLAVEGRQLARALLQETDGNPFFVLQIVRHLAESGVIGRGHDGVLVLPPDALALQLPESVHEVVGRRVARLGDDVEQTLGMAAVMGREFDIPVLAQAVEHDEDVVLQALETRDPRRVGQRGAGPARVVQLRPRSRRPHAVRPAEPHPPGPFAPAGGRGAGRAVRHRAGPAPGRARRTLAGRRIIG